MRLRKYLVKRTVHMVITLLIVLVLLFVLFRLMPGDAAMGLFMKPGITDIEKDQIALRYGFAKEIELPGNHFVYNYNPPNIGEYTMLIEVDGDSMQSTFHVNVDPVDTDLNPPKIDNIDVVVSGNSTITLMVNATDQSSFRNAKYGMTLPNWDTQDATVMTEVDSGNFEVQIFDAMAGAYSADIEVKDAFLNTATAAIKFNVTTDIVTGNIASVATTFKLWNIHTDIATGSIAENGDTVTVTAQAEGATDVSLSMLTPDNTSVAVSLTPSNTWYNGSYVIPDSGLYDIVFNADGIEGISVVPVNSDATAPIIPADSGVLSDFSIDLERNGLLVSDYPFIYNHQELTKVVINVTGTQSNGDRLPGSLTGMITLPDGSETIAPMTHPTDVVDRTLMEQFYYYMKSMLLFDFGNSFEDNRPVWDVILERVPPTLLLFGSSLILSYLIGIVVGVVVAWRRGTVMELGTIVVTLFLYSMPIFWSALIAQWIFFVQLKWFPLSGLGGVSETGEKLLGMAYVTDIVWHLALPLMTLTILHLAGTILLMRSSMLEVMGEDFITTARAKGLKTRQVVYKHAARNAMLPVVTSMALSLGGIISGGVLTETIFSWPGMGILLVRGTLMHNYPVVQGAFYIMAGMTVLGNMFADILYAYLDPRVQL
ncbi:MAG: ABC transporter permease [Thermoplasmata archaeon]|nr:ABC transporter permease [Thermoplasmata archaeon]